MVEDRLDFDRSGIVGQSDVCQCVKPLGFELLELILKPLDFAGLIPVLLQIQLALTLDGLGFSTSLIGLVQNQLGPGQGPGQGSVESVARFGCKSARG